MNKREKLMFRISLERLIYSMEYFSQIRDAGDSNIDEYQQKLRDTTQLESEEDIGFAEITSLYTNYLQKMYIKDDNKNMNKDMKKYLEDIVIMLAMASISPQEKKAGYVNNIMDIARRIKKEVPYRDFINFQRRVYTFDVEEVTVSTNLRQLMYILSYIHHKREIVAIDRKGTPTYASNFELYGGIFRSGLELEAITHSIIYFVGKGNLPNIRPSLLKSLNGELDKMGLRKFKEELETDINKVMTILTSEGELWFTKEYAKNIFKNETHVEGSSEIDVDTWGNLITIDREIQEGRTSIIYNIFTSLTRKNKMTAPNLLMNRKFLVPEEGLIITLDNKMDNIGWIEIREVHDTEVPYHKMLIRYHVDDNLNFLGDEVTMGKSYTLEYTLDIENMFNDYWQLQTEVSVVTVVAVMKALGILEDIIQDTENNFEQFFEGLGNEDSIEELTEEEKRGMIEVFRDLDNSIGSLTIEVPYHWNYDNNGKKTKGEGSNKTRTELKTVERFSRRLPEGHKPSKEAQELARKYKIKLDDGKTIVDTHVRTVNVKD